MMRDPYYDAEMDRLDAISAAENADERDDDETPDIADGDEFEPSPTLDELGWNWDINGRCR